MGYDVIVAGGGSAGCVTAARLSVDDRCRMLLLEAGPDYPAAGDLPADIADGSMPTTSHDWGLVSEPDEHGRSVPLPRGAPDGRLFGDQRVLRAAGMTAGLRPVGGHGQPGLVVC